MERDAGKLHLRALYEFSEEYSLGLSCQHREVEKQESLVVDDVTSVAYKDHSKDGYCRNKGLGVHLHNKVSARVIATQLGLVDGTFQGTGTCGHQELFSRSEDVKDKLLDDVDASGPSGATSSLQF